MGASCWTPLQGERRQEMGATGWEHRKLQAALQEAGSPVGTGSKARSLWCFLGPGAEPQVFSQPSASGRTGSPRQKRDLPGGHLAFTVPTVPESESLQGPFAR